MSKYLYTDKVNNGEVYVVIAPDPKRDGLLKSTYYKNKNLEVGSSHLYGKRHQDYLNELVKKSKKID